MQERRSETLPQMLKSNYELIPGKTALRFKDFGIWQTCTWSEYYDRVKAFALGLASLGFKKDDKIGIIGENQPQWYLGELAAQSLGGICVGIFVDAVSNEIKYILEHSDASIVIAHDQEQVDKILHIRDELPLLKHIIFWDPKGLWFYDDPILKRFDQVEEEGRKLEKERPGFFEKTVAEGKGEDCAVICYTSGTTGLPKGAMLSHKTLIETRKAWEELDSCPDGGNYLSFLSPAWATEQYLGVAGGLLSKFVVNFPEAAETVQENVREIEPHVIFYGARQWESINAMIHVKIASAGRINRWVYSLFMKSAYRHMKAKVDREKSNFLQMLLWMIANITVLQTSQEQARTQQNKIRLYRGSGRKPGYHPVLPGRGDQRQATLWAFRNRCEYGPQGRGRGSGDVGHRLAEKRSRNRARRGSPYPDRYDVHGVLQEPQGQERKSG